MSVFTLPASSLPPQGNKFICSVPLHTNPPMLASQFMNLYSANLMIFYNRLLNIFQFRLKQFHFRGNPPYAADFEIEAGEAVVMFSLVNPLTGSDIVFNGDGWCNILNQNNTTSPCP